MDEMNEEHLKAMALKTLESARSNLDRAEQAIRAGDYARASRIYAQLQQGAYWAMQESASAAREMASKN